MKYFRILLIFFVFLSCSNAKISGQDKINKKAETAYQEADNHMAFGRIDEALDGFLEAIEFQKDYLNAHIQVANIYQRFKKDYAQAALYYEKVITLDNTLINAYYNRVMSYYLAMDYSNAKKALKAYEQFPNLGEKGKKEVKDLEARILFAENAIKNPVEFEPKNLGSNVNSEKAEYFPAITADNEFLYFTVNDLNQKFPSENIYVSQFKNGEWQARTPLSSNINSRHNEGAHSISQDGRYLFFASDRPDNNQGRFDIYLAKKVGNDWKNPINLGKNINSYNWESQPVISADSKMLFFVRKSRDGYGGADIYVSHLQENGQFGPAENLGPIINTPGDEQRPYIHPDGKTLYFASDGHIGIGGGDIFMTQLQEDGSWSTPKNLGYPINTPGDEMGIYVSADGEIAFFSSDREGGFGAADIYSFKMPETAQPEQVIYVKGTVIDAVTKKPVEANVKIYYLETGALDKSVSSDALNGNFLVTLNGNKNYAYEALAKGYLPFSENFSLKDVKDKSSYEIEVALQPIEVGKEFVLKNIFFSTNEFELLEDSKTELLRLVAFLKTNKNIKLEVGGHTDNVGAASSNQVLSEKRAKSVYNFLIENGIAKERLNFKGYGASLPLVENDSEKNRATNRRTSFKVL